MLVVLSDWEAADVDVEQLSHASARLESPRLASVKKVLTETKIGCEVVMNMAKALNASSQGKAGDSRLSSAVALLHDGREPFAGQAATATRDIANLATCQDPRLVSWLEEALILIVEACEL